MTEVQRPQDVCHIPHPHKHSDLQQSIANKQVNIVIIKMHLIIIITNTTGLAGASTKALQEHVTKFRNDVCH